MNLIETVVAALHQHIRQQLGDQASGRDIVKDDDVINNPQCSQYLSPLCLVKHRSIRPLQLADSPVTIYRNDERIAERTRGGQVTHMPDVKQVKNTIGKHEPAACHAQTLPLGEHCPPGQNLFDH